MTGIRVPAMFAVLALLPFRYLFVVFEFTVVFVNVNVLHNFGFVHDPGSGGSL